MAQTLLTHEKMISNLIGDFSPSEHPELFKAGFHFVADLIPADHELWASDNLKGKSIPVDGAIVRGGSGYEVGGADQHLKVISVWRKSGEVWYKCKETPWDEFRQSDDTQSLYSAKREYRNPLYSISDGGRIFISPSPDGETASFDGEVPSGVKAYFRYWSYEQADFFGLSDSEITFDSYHITADLFGFPRDAQLPAIIKSAMNILHVKMGESVHEDEDSELLQLQQAQLTQLGQWFESEMSSLNIQYKKIGIEEE